MGRATAYDEKAGRTRNAAGIIRRFGKRVVTWNRLSDGESNL
jgi:hypothetical protein